VRGTLAGFLVVEHKHSARRWELDEVRFMSEVADIAAQVILHVRLREWMERLTILNEVFLDITSLEDVDVLLQKIVERAVALLNAEAGVFMETRIFGHPLLAAMTKGRVKLKEARGEAGGQLVLRGLFVAALVAAGMWMANHLLAGLPDARWRPLKVDAAYAENCGDCHFAYHPSLRTSDGWRRIMAGLADHFGEDATVAPEDTKRITAWLVANSAETFDTQAAVRIGRALAKGDRITATAFWKHRHRHIPKSVFASRAVGAKSNCKACHGEPHNLILPGHE